MSQRPLRSVSLQSFGPFAEVTVPLHPQLNVILGDNASGKSHLMKLLYTACSVPSAAATALIQPDESMMGHMIAEKLVGVYRPNSLGRLCHRSSENERTEVKVEFGGDGGSLAFGFDESSSNTVNVRSIPSFTMAETPVYIPSREILSLYPGLVALYESREVAFDETWRDTASLLSKPPLRGPREETVRNVLRHIDPVLGGSVVEEGGVFHLDTPGVGRVEAHLVAEGHRKLAMISRLVASGALLESGYLFWDEPEANLNPSALRAVASTVVALAASGVQVTIATHSMFVVRELSMQARNLLEGTRFVGLKKVGTEVVAEYGDDFADLTDVAALDALVEQSSRYLSDQA